MNIKSILPELKNRARKYAYYESYVTISGDDEVLIENVIDVLECNEIMLRVKAGVNEVVVWGENLKVSAYTDRSVTLTGKISTVEISKGGAKIL
ncbi:MAG: YabP/YqfC family sporulation protein [Oscillospiraceae bacterium]|nr:YabP/YqfC family sporulation protein [Oscillospiraceae bacterium]